MAIRFSCRACGKSVKAPDGAAGKKARCPTCNEVQVVPEQTAKGPPPSVSGPVDVSQLASGSAATGPASAPAGTVSCPDCTCVFGAGATLCPSCGWVNQAALRPMQAAPGVGPPVAQAATFEGGSLGVDCLKAIAYGASNFGAIGKLVLYSIGLAILLELIRWLLMPVFMTPAGPVLALTVACLVPVTMGGYFLRFYLDCVISSLEGVNDAPDVPPFQLGDLFRTGLKGTGVILVYALPVITLPLLPLALLALGYSSDNRAYDVAWAARAAARKPGALVVLWLVLLLWLAVMITAVFVIYSLAALSAVAMVAGKEGLGAMLTAFLILVIGAGVAAVVFHMFMAVIFRCIGLLGRRHPELTDMLPERPNAAAVTVGFVLGAVALGGWTTLYYWYPQAKRETPEQLRRTGGLRAPSARGRGEAPRAADYTDSTTRLDESRRRLRMLDFDLRSYARRHGGQFPNSLEDLVRDRPLMSTENLRQPGSDKNFQYVSGQGFESPGDNILAYDPYVYRGNRMVVLQVNEMVVVLSTDQVTHKLLMQKGGAGRANGANRAPVRRENVRGTVRSEGLPWGAGLAAHGRAGLQSSSSRHWRRASSCALV